jgi:hypothetical protein
MTKADGEAALPADDEGVGYRRPPKEHRFRKGRSGNPKGRPKKPKPPMLVHDADIFRRLDAEQITLGGKAITRRHAELQRLLLLAISGDRRAKRLIERMWRSGGGKQQGGVMTLPLSEFEKLWSN